MYIKYSECVFLVSGIQHAKGMGHIILLSVACPGVKMCFGCLYNFCL